MPTPNYPRVVVIVAIVIAIMVLAIGTSACHPTADRPHWVDPIIVTEDSPDWDCQRMGNRTCGPTLTITLSTGVRVTLPNVTVLEQYRACMATPYNGETSELEAECLAEVGQ